MFSQEPKFSLLAIHRHHTFAPILTYTSISSLSFVFEPSSKVFSYSAHPLKPGGASIVSLICLFKLPTGVVKSSVLYCSSISRLETIRLRVIESVVFLSTFPLANDRAQQFKGTVTLPRFSQHNVCIIILCKSQLTHTVNLVCA